ncbi:MAG TPA: UDP-4-amino-4,6-dideoxy-N-acetyl-beta-L-altrosamine transaminase, partial [Candidatus Omnitrophota bacterium]|nr:UDP-4-amino-4,6-dideoxy-N-acetyl-beta-L-altrosamine transaminase [Candidatus Omnitrophota bacterium]
MRTEFLVFGSPYFGPEEEEEVLDSMRRSWIGTGPKVKLFETAFAQY